MAFFAIAVPIPASKLEQWRQFIGELTGARRRDYEASRRQLGVHERTFLQQTPQGDMVIVTLEGEDPARAFQRFGQGDDAFTRWFVQQVREIHSVDLSQPPPGPLPELVADSGSI